VLRGDVLRGEPVTQPPDRIPGRHGLAIKPPPPLRFAVEGRIIGSWLEGRRRFFQRVDRSQTTRERDQTMPFTLLSDDELIARLLIHTWTLTTGKVLRCDVPPHELTEEELIDFWSDDRFD
jgi:hypothetical protein